MMQVSYKSLSIQLTTFMEHPVPGQEKFAELWSQTSCSLKLKHTLKREKSMEGELSEWEIGKHLVLMMMLFT